MTWLREILSNPANCIAVAAILVLAAAMVWAMVAVRFCQRCGFEEAQCKCGRRRS